MAILDSNSLVETLDNINERILYDEVITPDEGLEASQWIISRQGEKGSYRGLFAPTQYDFDHGIHLFTGEKLECASARHIIGQESARALWLLGSRNPVAREAYHRATGWIQQAPEFQQSGVYCCGRCSLAFWRHFWVGDFEDKEVLITRGLKMMKNLRLGDGKWRTYPFFYAIYTLTELDLEPAREELTYARLAIEKHLKHSRAGFYSQRRSTIFTKALEILR